MCLIFGDQFTFAYLLYIGDYTTQLYYVIFSGEKFGGMSIGNDDCMEY